MEELKKILELVEHKNKIDRERDEAKYMDLEWLSQSIIDEVYEVREEIKPNNIAHLEDELSDIFWGWLTLVEKLRDTGYVESHEAIIRRALKKYEERILPLKGTSEDHDIWKEVKEEQKRALKVEKELRSYRMEVRDYYQHYYEESDEAHLIDHADDVCTLALNINRGMDCKLIVLASYLHDMYNREKRSTHNELAYAYVLESREDKFLNELSTEERKMVAYAVLEHRASFKGEFFSCLSEIISSADRGLPNLEAIVIRSMKFNFANADAVFSHIKAKYGTYGYAKYPEVYQEIFEAELKAFRNLVNQLKVKDILAIWDVYQEKKKMSA